MDRSGGPRDDLWRQVDQIRVRMLVQVTHHLEERIERRLSS
jgi:hypothetical protein